LGNVLKDGNDYNARNAIKHSKMEITGQMVNGKTRSMLMGLAVLALLITMTIPISVTTAANTSRQTRQNSDLINPATERTSPETSYWAMTYGGSQLDAAYAIQQTTDGGYIVAASTNSSGAGADDFWVFKLNSTGGVVWSNTYGGTSYDDPTCIQQTTDGGYIVAGTTYSFSGLGAPSAWILKLDSNGGIIWENMYGGSGFDEINSIQQNTTDGSYIVAGTTNSGLPGYEAWVMKLSSTGSVVWSNTYGTGKYDDTAYSVGIANGSYVVAGSTNQFDSGGYDHAWVMKLNSTGGVIWQNTYGGSGNDEAYSVQQTTDGGYIVAGSTNSTNSAGYDDFWVFKLNSTGGVAWSYTYSDTNYDDAYSIQQTTDGGYIVGGTTYSISTGLGSFWLLKLNQEGIVDWQNTYGGSNDNELINSGCVQQTSDGGYIAAGTTDSFGVGIYNVWVIKLEGDGSITWGSGSGASTSATTATPSGFSVTNSTTYLTSANNTLYIQNSIKATNASPQAFSAKVTEQSPETLPAPSGIPTTIILVAIVAIVLVIAVVLILRSRSRSRARAGPISGPIQQRPMQQRQAVGQVVICPQCGARNVPGAKFCRNCGASLQG
jgi:hypothetical protein